MADNPIAPLPVEALRTQFPVLAQPIHGQPLAYLDNAATTHMPLPVLAALQQLETTQRANIHRGVHTLSQRATDASEHGAQRTVAAGVDGAADQCARNAADDQAGGAVRLAATQPPVVTAPFAIAVATTRIRVAGGGDQRRQNHRGGAQRQHEPAHILLPQR